MGTLKVASGEGFELFLTGGVPELDGDLLFAGGNFDSFEIDTNGGVIIGLKLGVYNSI